MSARAGDTVATRFRRLADRLTPSERRLAATIGQNYPVSGLGSITALARASGVSTPTVARMARKLGFSGFPGFQAALRAELEATLSNPITKHENWAQTAGDGHILNRFADAALENMRQSLRRIDPATFDAVAALLADRTRAVSLCGGRITGPLAAYFRTHLQVIRGDVALLSPGDGAWPHRLLDMAAGDVLIVFDIRRYERALMTLTEMAADAGAEVAVVTDQWGSPAARRAAHAFHLRIEAPSAWDSSVAPLFLVEALIAAVQAATWGQTRERIRRLEALFERTGQFR